MFELGAHAPSLVVSERVAILLEEGVDARDSAIPRILEVLERQTAVLRRRLLTLERVLGPDALRVDELGLPRLDVAVQVGNELVLVVRHTRAEVGDADVRLFGPAEIRLRDEHVTHGEHAQTAQLLGGVEDDGWETRGHFRVEADLDARLDLVLTLDEEVEQLLRVDDRLAEVRHQTDQRRVPLVDDLGERRRAGRHEDLADAVVELGHRLVVDAQEALRRPLLGDLVLQVPDAVAVRKLFVRHAALGQDAALEAGHVEQQVGVVLGVDGHERALPQNGRHGARQPVLDVPKDGAAEVHVRLHEAHAGVAWPALFVVVADDVLVVRVGVFRQVALHQLLGLLGGEAQVEVHAVDVARVQPDGMGHLRRHVLERQEVVGHLRRASHFRGALQAQHQQVEHQAKVLGDERGELQAADDAVRVGVVHVLVVDDHVVLGRHVIGNVVVDDEAQQSIQQRQVDLFVELLELGLKHHVALAISRLPHILAHK